MSDINFIIYNLDEINELSFKDIGKKISKGYDSTKEFISDTADDIKNKFGYIHHHLSNLISHNKYSLLSIENRLKDAGVDVLKLKSLASKESKKVLFKIRKDEFNIFTFVKLIANRFNTAFNECLPKKNSIVRQSIVGITLLAFAFFVNTALMIAFSIIFGPNIGNILCGCIAAPFTEELGKIISVNQDAGGAYFLIFNIAEWTLYVKNVMAMVTGLPAFAAIAIIRTLCVYSHYLWHRIHAASSKTAESREAGMKIGMIFHCLHNFLASTPASIITLPVSIYLGRATLQKINQQNQKSKPSKMKSLVKKLF